MKLTTKNFKKIDLASIVALSVAFNGAMGHPGQCLLVDEDDNVYISTCIGDSEKYHLSEHVVCRAFNKFWNDNMCIYSERDERKDCEWIRYYLGMGNNFVFKRSFYLSHKEEIDDENYIHVYRWWRKFIIHLNEEKEKKADRGEK